MRFRTCLIPYVVPSASFSSLRRDRGSSPVGLVHNRLGREPVPEGRATGATALAARRDSRTP
jgi:hypothetical protein